MSDPLTDAGFGKYLEREDQAPAKSTATVGTMDPITGKGPLYQDLSLFSMPANFRGRPAWLVQLWWIVQDTLFRLSPVALFGWRTFLLRLFGARIGRNVRLRSTVRVTYPWKLTVGDNVWVGDDCVLYNLDQISLGSNVALGHQVYLCTGLHDYGRLDFRIEAKPIYIEEEVWLTNDVFIGPGVTVGRASVVGTRSLVLKDLPAAMMCYGSPARAVKPRPRDGSAPVGYPARQDKK